MSNLLLGVIGLLWLANVAIVAVAVVQARDRRGDAVGKLARSRSGADAGTSGVPIRFEVARPAPTAPSDRADVARLDTFAGTAAAIEAFVAGVDLSAGGASRRGLDAPGIPTTSRAPGLDSATVNSLPRPFPMPAAVLAEPAVSMDDGLDEPPGSAAWDRILHDESTRISRYRRPATVVLGEVPDLDVLAQRLGPVAADRVANEVARLVQAEHRGSDRLVRLGPASFAVLLVETPEIDAGSYVARIRAVADGWFASAGLSTRLRIGWAGPDDAHDLVSAAATARERMFS